MRRPFPVPSDPCITNTMSQQSASGPLLFWRRKASLISCLIKATTENHTITNGIQKKPGVSPRQLETIIFSSVSALTCYYSCSAEAHSILRQRHIQYKEEKQGAKLSVITLVTVFIDLTNHDDPCAAFADQQSCGNLRKRQSLLPCTSKEMPVERKYATWLPSPEHEVVGH